MLNKVHDRGAYDLIGDIHGHADELIKLLKHMDYEDSPTGYCHSSRKIIFVGDFIDRGENIRQHKKLLGVIMPMVNNGHALAVMGNHEFNALAFHTQHEGQPLREHTDKNIRQHQAFLNEYDLESELKSEVLKFFYSLPIWIEVDGIRVVHACWDQHQIEVMKSKTKSGRLSHDLLVEASTEGSDAYKAIEILLKGVEVKLSNGITFLDEGGDERNAVRVQWWNSDARCLGEVAINVEIGEAGKQSIPDDVPRYTPDQPPCFIGHYWLSGDPKPLTNNVVCLDYSIANYGKLAAYRWDGEQLLKGDKFTYTKDW